jgi:NitT/TauT family transport system ATP-binding protein
VVAKVVLDGVTKVFVDNKRGRETTALKGVSLSIDGGQFVCLLGPSGCGKSTVLNLLAGFEYPTEGKVLFSGQPITAPGADRSVVFQQPQLFPWLNVVQNISFGQRMSGRPKSEYVTLAKHYIQLMGLSGFETHYPYELSGGMQQRVALARAWISKPEFFLMDEPFGALDAQTRLMMQELLLRVWDESRTTVLFVTHDIDEALFLADRVVLMSARPGRIIEDLKLAFPRPRDYETLLFEKEYVSTKRHVLHIIREQTMELMKARLKDGAEDGR